MLHQEMNRINNFLFQDFKSNHTKIEKADVRGESKNVREKELLCREEEKLQKIK